MQRLVSLGSVACSNVGIALHQIIAFAVDEQWGQTVSRTKILQGHVRTQGRSYRPCDLLERAQQAGWRLQADTDGTEEGKTIAGERVRWPLVCPRARRRFRFAMASVGRRRDPCIGRLCWACIVLAAKTPGH
jgi:hypothetical protein